MDGKEKLAELLSKYHHGTCSDEELRLLEQWFLELELATKEDTVFSNEDELKLTRDRMRENIHQNLTKQVSRPVRKLWVPFLKIASVLLLVAFIGYYFISLAPTERIDTIVENYVPIWDTISTEQGKIKKVILTDQSVLFLSANSQIRIASGFSKKNRNLELLFGEAWFDVIKNPDLPFTVKSGELQTIVLGTQFTVTAYPLLKKIEVHVNRGNVKVQGNNQVQDLVVGQSVRYNLADKKLRRHDLSVIFDPENQRYLIDGCSFDELAMRIEDIFGYKLIPANESVRKRHYTGEIKINQSVRTAISKFLEIHQHKFEIIGKEVRMQ